MQAESPTVIPLRPYLKRTTGHALTEYEAACLAGHRLPDPGDTKMEERCRRVHRIREWAELFLRIHGPKETSPDRPSSSGFHRSASRAIPKRTMH
jgi:hypothetical protein